MAAATSSHAAPATTAAVGSNTANNTSETIIGLHVLSIDGFSATKDLEVGKSIKSSMFRVGGHSWYIECYPCGDVEGSAGWVSLFLCQGDYHPGSRVRGECKFTMMESLKDGRFGKLIGASSESIEYYRFKDDDRRHGFDFMKREKLESLLKDDCFHVRCIVLIYKFPHVPLPDLATGSHVVTVDGYSKFRRAFDIGEGIESSTFRVGGRSWYVDLYPCGEDEYSHTGVAAYFNACDPDPGANDEVKARFEITLLSRAGQIISSVQDFFTCSANSSWGFYFLGSMEHESSPLLQDGFHIRFDMAVVEGITAVQPPTERPDDLHRHFGNLLASQVGTDVTFEVGGTLFSAHKIVLAARSTAFMAEFFGPAGKETAGVTQVLRIDDMEPRVFKALLHFIYTEEALPEVREEDKIMLAQGLLVAADRYAMERLKLICADMLCTCIDATTAVSTLELAHKHGCRKLKEACTKVIGDWVAKFAS